MAEDILSQSEIDELMKSLADSENTQEAVDETPTHSTVREYDFVTANKFPKEQIRALGIIYEKFARLLTSHLTALLRTNCEIDLIAIEEYKFKEYYNSLPSTSLLAIINVHPMYGSSLLQLPQSSVYAIIHRLFGGSGVDDDEKTFTEIELAISERVLRPVVRLMDEAWEKVTNTTSSLVRLETSAQFAQIVQMNETIAFITLSVKIDDVSDLMTICLPRMALQPVSKMLSPKVWFSTGVSSDSEHVSYNNEIRNKLMTTPVTMRACFEESNLSAGDILNLKVGDYIKMDHPVDKAIMVSVEHIPKFLGIIGKCNSKMAVQVMEVVKNDEGDDQIEQHNVQ